MPLKIIGTVIMLLVFTFFAGFNNDNKCNVNLIFREYQNVPVFFSLMCAFLAGIVVTLPHTFGRRRKMNKNKEEKEPKENKKKKKDKKQEQENAASASGAEEKQESKPIDFNQANW